MDILLCQLVFVGYIEFLERIIQRTLISSDLENQSLNSGAPLALPRLLNLVRECCVTAILQYDFFILHRFIG